MQTENKLEKDVCFGTTEMWIKGKKGLQVKILHIFCLKDLKAQWEI